MKWIAFYNYRKYLFRLFLSITLLVVLCLVILSSFLYSYAKHTVLKVQQESTQSLLNQVRYNVDHLNDLVRNFTFSLYFQGDMTVLMQSKTVDIFSLSNILTRLEQNVSVNSFIHSVMIYNANNACYYSTQGSTRENCGEDVPSNMLHLARQSGQSLPKLTLVPGESGDYFSYFMYDAAQYSKDDSILMVNVKAQWLFDNIRAINALNMSARPSILLLDRDGRFIEADKSADIPAAELEKIRTNVTTSASPHNYFIMDGSDKQIVTYVTSQENGWKVIGIQSYDAVFGQIERLRTVSLSLLFVLIGIALVVSIALSLRLYKPVGRLVKDIRGKSASPLALAGRGEDELSLMSQVYNDMYDSFHQLRLKHSENTEVVKSYYLRLLTTQSRIMPEEKLRELIEVHHAQLQATGPYLVCVLRIDEFYRFHVRYSKQEQQAIKFAIGNIASEIFVKLCMNQAVDMKEDHVVIILCPPEADKGQLMEGLVLLCAEIQKVVMDYYQVSMTASLSGLLPLYSQISSGYEQALKLSQYRLVCGKQAVITPMQVQAAEEDDFHMPAEIERNLVKSIRSNDLPAFEDSLREIFKHIARVNYDSMVHNVLHLVMVVNRTIHELELSEHEINNINLKDFIRQVLEKDTLDEMFVLFSEFARQFAEQRRASKDNKHDFLIERINDIIAREYVDSNLSLNTIASALKMSPSYVGRLYRQSEGRSVADVLNEVRMAEAKRLLETSEETISAIIQQVGFTNEGNFFRLFQKLTGMTPREYRSRRWERQQREE